MVDSIRRYSIYLAPKTFSRHIVLFEDIQVLGGVVMGMENQVRVEDSKEKRHMIYRLMPIFFITLSVACSGADIEGEKDYTDPRAQEEHCADCEENPIRPTLLERPQPPTLEDGTDFSDWAPEECPPGYMPEFGRDNCISIGDPCPVGDWPESLPTSDIKYVKPGGLGDGSSPQNAAGSIQQMLDASNSSTTIALSKGTFNEAFEVSGGQDIVGACATDTVIQGPPGSALADATVLLSGPGGARLKNVTVTGDRFGVRIISSLSPATISGVIVEAAKDNGLLIHYGTAEIDRIIIRNTQIGTGISVYQSELSMSHVLLTGDQWGIAVGGGSSTVIASDVVIQNKQTLENCISGRGISVGQRASLTLSRSFLSGTCETAMDISGVDTTVTASHLVIQDTLRRVDGTYGSGINVDFGASLDLSHALLKRNSQAGMEVAGERTTVRASDLLIQDTLGGSGITVNQDATLTLSRSLLYGNHGVGMSLWRGGFVEANNLQITNTQSNGEGMLGHGIELALSSELSLERTFIDSNRGFGILAIGPGYNLSASDLTVTDTKILACAETDSEYPPCFEDFELGVILASSATEGGDGILLLGNGDAQLNGFVLNHNARVGLHLYDTTGTDWGDYWEGLGYLAKPVFHGENGTIGNNDYGINIRGAFMGPADFAEQNVDCFNNRKNIDGCYSNEELSAPVPFLSE